MTGWRADITNDPLDDYNLVVDIAQGNVHRASIVRVNGRLVVRWYASAQDCEVPLDWLRDVLARAAEELDEPSA